MSLSPPSNPVAASKPRQLRAVSFSFPPNSSNDILSCPLLPAHFIPAQDSTVELLVPNNFSDIWDILSGGCLTWDPTTATVRLPVEVDKVCLALLRSNRTLSKRSDVDEWARESLVDRLKKIRDHCEDIISGKTPRSCADEYIMSLVRFDDSLMREFWVAGIIGTSAQSEAARASVDELVYAIHSDEPNRSVFHEAAKDVGKNLIELLSLVRTAWTQTLECNEQYLEWEMQYEPFTSEEKDDIEYALDCVQKITKMPVLNPQPREELLYILRSIRKTFRRPNNVEAKFQKLGINTTAKGDEDHSESPPYDAIEIEKKRFLVQHVDLVERHIRICWREIFIAIEHCLETQLACFLWIDHMMAEYCKTADKIKKTRNRAKNRLHIEMHQKRMGKNLSKWDSKAYNPEC
ncbi:hypothetical protein H072_10019 [Dactylellina haptotyla CBS 200.50]|uniref:Uncharacterized protein n=1 Tax=Dactylellina haptotyla (strain CBS 200.50) TaxID=1284197 RepID=S8A5Q4_DACHA|nr:hypothetical protein H072_10019 [Dactylellina haptotyla CBS 200.50]